MENSFYLKHNKMLLSCLMWLGDSDGRQQLQLEIAIGLFHNLNAYLHVLASGSNTSMVFKYVVPSKPPTAISCPFTTARPTCKTSIMDSSYLAGKS